MTSIALVTSMRRPRPSRPIGAVTKCQIRFSPLAVVISRSPLSMLSSRSNSDAITPFIASARAP